jgi:structural maintenance of chromosome 1
LDCGFARDHQTYNVYLFRQTERECEEKLADIYQKLTEAKYDRRETERTARFKEALETMKRIYPGVHGRIVDLCKPLQRRYEMSVAIILGKNMDAIVVDEKKTAIECIKVKTVVD